MDSFGGESGFFGETDESGKTSQGIENIKKV